ncbi:hypothetical protein FB645_001064 [Coemansia sp. IMI 203386]|nr:hypothetical protein FB645_001064 [Coemansia sp. IMI 203386]
MTVSNDKCKNKADLDGRHVYEFCPADNAIFPRCMIHYYYRNADNIPDFMDFATLKSTFHHTLSVCLPMTLGSQVHMETPPFGKLTITVDGTSPRLPPVTKHVDTVHTVAEMAARGFVIASQPSVLAEAPLMLNPLEGDPLVTLDVVYMADGVGLLLAFSHAIVDLPGFQKFVDQWSCLNRSLVSKQRTIGYLPQQLDTDRMRFWNAVLKYPEPETSDIEQHLDMLVAAADKNNTVECLSSATKENNDEQIQQVCPEIPSDYGVYRIEVPLAAIDELTQLKAQICPEVTVPNLIAATLWRCLSLTHPSSSYTYFANSLSIRNNTEFTHFCGNTATIKYTYQKTATIISQNIFQTSQQIQRSARSFGVGEFARIIKGYVTSGSKYSSNLTRFVETHRVPRLIVTNVSRIPFYETDFGYGTPIKLFFPATVPPGLCAFTPLSKEGGIDILIRTTENAIENIKSDQLLGERIVVYRHDMA